MTLWTPSGEHPVDRRGGSGGDTGSSGPAAAEHSAPTSASGAPPGDQQAPGEPPSLEDLTPEQRAEVEEMARQMEAAQARMLKAPAGAVIGQQALQFYELAALYLSQDPPRLDDGRAAIDAFVAVVDKLGDRLGEAHQPLRQALNQIQLAYVEVASRSGGSTSTD